MLRAGDHVLSVNDVYGGTNRYFSRVAGPIGLQTTFVDMKNLDNVRRALRPSTKIVWIESPTNPTLGLVDIRALAAIVHAQPGVILVVDNTFLSPYFQVAPGAPPARPDGLAQPQRPLSLGADLVYHSVTKYINGHSDAVMGVVVANDDELHARLRFLQNGWPCPSRGVGARGGADADTACAQRWARSRPRSTASWPTAGSRRCTCAWSSTSATRSPSRGSSSRRRTLPK
jgi:cystathionine gamma-lyase